MGESAARGTRTAGLDCTFFNRRGIRTGQGGRPVLGSTSAGFGEKAFFATLSFEDTGAHPDELLYGDGRTLRVPGMRMTSSSVILRCARRWIKSWSIFFSEARCFLCSTRKATAVPTRSRATAPPMAIPSMALSWIAMAAIWNLHAIWATVIKVERSQQVEKHMIGTYEMRRMVKLQLDRVKAVYEDMRGEVLRLHACARG